MYNYIFFIVPNIPIIILIVHKDYSLIEQLLKFLKFRVRLVRKPVVKLD
jgi:hypothetical protein